MITLDRLKELLIYDPETGIFTNRIDRGSRAYAGTKAGSLTAKGYIELMIDRKAYKASRLAHFYMTGEWPKHEMDHINHIRHDNRWANLRDITHADNIVHRDARLYKVLPSSV